MASSVLNYKYDVDPLLKDSFVEDCELVVSMTEQPNQAICLKYIKSKIVGRAREMLPETIEKVTDITDVLKEKIKADNSSVIEGRLTALRVYKGNFTNFSDAFRRSLIGEGFAKTKADELTIVKTKELCRCTARSDVVKSIIASTKFDTPAEVIAKLITEGEIAKKEKKEHESYQKRSNNKHQNGKFIKNNGKHQHKGKFNHKPKNSEGGAGGRKQRNDHFIRIVADITPSTSGKANRAIPNRFFVWARARAQRVPAQQHKVRGFCQTIH